MLLASVWRDEKEAHDANAWRAIQAEPEDQDASSLARELREKEKETRVTKARAHLSEGRQVLAVALLVSVVTIAASWAKWAPQVGVLVAVAVFYSIWAVYWAGIALSARYRVPDHVDFDTHHSDANRFMILIYSSIFLYGIAGGGLSQFLKCQRIVHSGAGRSG